MIVNDNFAIYFRLNHLLKEKEKKNETILDP